jgi:hypothetical protein
MDRAFYIPQARVLEGQEFYLVDRVYDPSGALLTSSVLNNWDVAVFDLTSVSPETAVFELNAQAATNGVPVYDTLQTDGYSFDAGGYNFRHRVTTAQVDYEGGHSYRFEYQLHHSTQGMIPLVFVVHVMGIYS